MPDPLSQAPTDDSHAHESRRSEHKEKKKHKHRHRDETPEEREERKARKKERRRERYLVFSDFSCLILLADTVCQLVLDCAQGAPTRRGQW